MTVKKLLAVFGFFLVSNVYTVSSNESVYKNPRIVKGKYILHFDRSKLNFSTLDIWLLNIIERENQKDVHVSLIPEPNTKSKDEFGNELLYYHFTDKSKEDKIIMKFSYSAYETDYTVNPEQIGEYDKESKFYQLYTKEENYIKFTSEVKELSRKIATASKNPYFQANEVYKWIIENMEFKEIPTRIGGYSVQRGVEYSLPRKTGDCGEYSFIFIACCRYLKIPARFVAGSYTKSGEGHNHAWSEIYFPNYGWLPVDCAAAQGVSIDPEMGKALSISSKKDYFFGNLDNKRIIYQKGMNITLKPPLQRKKVVVLQPFYLLINGKEIDPNIAEVAIKSSLLFSETF